MSNSSNLFLWKLAIPIPIRVNEKLVEIIAEEFCVHWSQGRSFDLIKEDVLREFVRGLAIVGIDCRATDKLNQYLKSTVRRFWKDGNAENKSNLLLSSAWIGRSKADREQICIKDKNVKLDFRDLATWNLPDCRSVVLDKVLVQGWTHGELVIDWLYSLKLSRSFTSMNEVKGKYLECLVLKAKLDQDWETLQLQMLQTSHPKLSSSPEGNGGVGGVCRSKEPDKKKGKGEEEETDRGTGTTLVSTGAGQTCKDKDKNTKKDSCFRKLTRRACERLEMKKREWHDSSRKADTELQHWQTVVTGAEAVCNIRCRGGRTGTGFLIAEGLIMTNAHVIANKEDALSAKITFRYDDNHQRGSDVSNVGESDKNDGDTRDTNQEEETEDARNTRSRYKLEVRLAPDEFFITSPKVAFTIPDAKHLDYTVVKLKLHRDAPSHCGSKETDTSTSNNRIENNKYIKNMISDGTPSNIDTTVKNNDRISEVNTNIEFTNNNIHENNDNNDNCTKDTNADSSTKVALELQRLKVVSSIIRSIPPLQIFHPATLRTIPHFRDVVGVIQHPQGRQKQYSEDRVTKVGKFFLRYKADTDSGSSGAPVLDYDGRVVALHHKNVSASGRENQGVMMTAIIQDLLSRRQGHFQLLLWRRMKPWQLQLKHIAVTMTAFDGSSTTSGNSNTANSNSTNHSLGHGNSNSSSSSYGSHSGSSNNGNCSALSSSGDCGNERCHAEGRGMYSSYHFQKGCLELLAQPGLRYLYQLKPPHNHQDHYPLYHHLDSSSADKIKGRERKEIINAQARSTDGEADKERVRRERLVSESGIFLAIGNAMTKHASLMRLAHTAMSNLFSIINDRHVLPIAPANTAHIDRHQYDHPFHIHDGRAHHSLDPDPGHDVSKITVDFGNSKICSSHRKNNSTNNQTSTPSESDNNKQDKYQSNENDDIHCGNSCRNASSPSSSGNDAAHCGSSLPHYYPYITGPRVRTRSLSLFTLLELLYKDIGVEYNGRKGAAMHRRQKLTIKKSESDDSKYNIRDRDNSAGERMHILGCDSSYAYLSPSLIMALYTYVQSQQEGKRQAEGRSKIAMEVMREMKGIESELLAQKKENTELSTKVVDMQGQIQYGTIFKEQLDETCSALRKECVDLKQKLGVCRAKSKQDIECLQQDDKDKGNQIAMLQLQLELSGEETKAEKRKMETKTTQNLTLSKMLKHNLCLLLARTMFARRKMQKTKRKYTEKILEYQANVEKLEHQHESQSNTIKMMREEHQANRQALSTVKLSLSTTQQTLAEELLSRRAYEKKLEEKTEELRRGWAREQELVQCVSEQREALLAMNEWKEGRVEKDRREQKAKQLEEKQKKKDNDDRNQLQAERQEGSQRQRQRISALAAMVKKQHACNRRLLGVMGLMWIKKKKQNEQREREEEKVSKERLSLMQVLTAERERYKREIEGKEEALRKQQQTYLKMEMAKERRRGEITKANEINQQNELELSREQYDLRKSAPRPIEEKGREEKVMAYLSLPAADVVELQSESESDDVDPCAREEDGDDDDDGSMNESKSKERDEFEHESEKQGHPGHESDASDESDDGADTESDEDNDFYSHDTYQLSLDQWKYSVQTRQPTLFHRHSLPVYAESAVPLSTKVITSNTPREGHANSLNYTNGEAGNSDGAFPHHRPPLSQHEQQAPVLITDIFRGKAILKSISSTSNPRLEKTRAKSLSIPYCNLGDIYCRSKHSHNQSPTLSHTNYHNLLTSEPSPSSFPSPSPSHSQLSLQQAHSTNQWYPYIPPHTQQEQKYQQYQRQQFPPTLEKVGRTKKKTSTRRSEGNIRGNKHSKRSKCRENNMTEGGAMVFQTPSLSYFSKSKSMKASKSTRGLQTHYIYNTEDGNSTRNTKGGGKRNKTKCKASSIKTHSDTGRRKLARSQSMVLRKEEEYLLGTNAHLYARTPIYAPYTTDRGKKTRKKRKASRVRV